MIFIIVSRKFGPSGLGIITFGLAFISYFLIIGDSGLNVLGQREIAAFSKRRIEIAPKIFTLKLLFSIFSFLILSLSLLIIKQPSIVKIIILLFGINVLIKAFTPEWYFYGIEKMSYFAIATFLDRFVYASLTIIILLFFTNIIIIPIGWCIGSFIAASFLFYHYKKHNISRTINFDIDSFKALVSKSLPMSFALFMTQVYFNFDTVMLGFLKTSEEVGLYNAGYKIILLIISFASLYGKSILPSFSRLYISNDKKNLKKAVHDSFRYTISIGVIVALIFIFFADKFFLLLYGTNFDNGIFSFQLLSISILTIFGNATFSFMLLASDKQKNYLKIISAGALLNLFLNFLLIPKYSIIGAAIATIMTEITIFVLLILFSKKVLTLNLSNIITKIIPASTITLIVFSSINIYWLLELFIGVIIYFTLLLIFKVFKTEDINMVKSFFRKETNSELKIKTAKF